MRRRQLLSGAAAFTALGGCLGGGTDSQGPGNGELENGSSENGSTSGNDTSAEEEFGYRPAPHAHSLTTRLGGLDRSLSFDPPFVNAAPLYLGVTEPRPGGDDDPPTVVVFLQNHHPEEPTEADLAGGDVPMLNEPVPTARPEQDARAARILLVPVSDHDLATRVPAVERDGDGVWYLADDADRCVPRSVTVPPRSAVAGRFALVARERGTGIAPGSRVFAGDPHGIAVHVWRTSAPGPTTESRFAFGDVRGGVSADRAVAPFRWYHDATASTMTYLEPERETVTVPATLHLTMINRSQEALDGGLPHSRLYKIVDGRLYDVSIGRMGPRAEFSYPPGREKELLLAVAHDGEPPDPDEETLSGISRGWLGGGRYAVVSGVERGGRAHAAALHVDAPERTVVPMDAEVVDAEGDTKTVRAPPDESVRSLRVTVRRTADGGEPVIAEQLMQDDVLRTAIGHMDRETEAVTVVWTSGALGHPLDDLDGFRYGDSAYSVVRGE